MAHQINKVIEKLNEEFGERTIFSLADKEILNIEYLKTGVECIDKIMGDGIPTGRICEFFGEESCLSEGTFIPYVIRNVLGKNQSRKGGSIEKLYKRFNNIAQSGSGNYSRRQTINSGFYVPSINEEDRIIWNKITDVIATGVKRCFKVKSELGNEIVCTNDHRFYIGNGKYKRLSDLSAGDEIYIHNNTHFKKLHSIKNHNCLRFIVVKDFIKQISPCGNRPTYDIKCKYPYNNFVANGFVVHNCGKTTLCLKIIASVQKAGKLCALIDTEHSIDLEWCRKLGVDTDKLLLSQPEYGEQALEITRRLIESEQLGIIVIDSVAALVPKCELEGEIGDANIGVQARLMSQAMRMLKASLAKSKTALIFTNQQRDKIGVFFGNPKTTCGGNALKYYASVRLQLTRKKVIKDKKEIIGTDVKAKIVKNKVANPFAECIFEIKWDGTIDEKKGT